MARALGLSQVKDKVGLSRSTIYELVSRGEFPGPTSFGKRKNLWAETEVDGWLAALFAKRDGEKG